MNQGIIVTLLSLVFYLTNIFGGSGQPAPAPLAPLEQQSYYVLGQNGRISSEVVVRRAPGAEAEALGRTGPQATIVILDQVEGWYKIRLNAGLEGWVPDYQVQLSEVEPKTSRHIVLGYLPGDETAGQSLLEHGGFLTALSPLGWRLDSYGALQANFDPVELGRNLYFAGNQQIRTYANIELASNPSRLLGSSHLQERSIDDLLSTLDDWGLSGVLLDLGYLPQEEQIELFQFVGILSERLKQSGRQTILALPWDSSLNYGEAVNAADYLLLKAGAPGLEVKPGPLAAAPEVESMLEQIAEQVPLDKVILGLNGAGIDWPRSGLPTALSHTQIMELAAAEGASIKWDAPSKSPYFGYGGGHEVWFENSYSLKYKVELVQKQRLAGIALLNLGQEDPAAWSALSKLL